MIYAQTDTLVNQTDGWGLKQGKWIFFEDACERLYNNPAEIHIEFLNDTIHGKYEVYDEDGTLRFEYQVHKGDRVGLGYEYHISGRVYRIYYHFADKEAYTLEFDNKGKLYCEYTERDGKNIGSYKVYKNGRLYAARNFNDDGQLNGPFIYYYRNGLEHNVLLFDDGIIVRQKRYSRRGKLTYDSDVMQHQ